jgi:hypothetical protein
LIKKKRKRKIVALAKTLLALAAFFSPLFLMSQSFFAVAAEPLIGPSSFRPALSCSVAHSSPKYIRQLKKIPLIPREQWEQQFSSFFLPREKGGRWRWRWRPR